MNPSDIIIYCCHVNRNYLFEDSMKRLRECGFRIMIQETGTGSFGTYQGPCDDHWSIGRSTWDLCLLGFKRRTPSDYKYIFLADFDLFFTGVKEFLECVEQVIEGEYDHVSRYKIPADQDRIDFGNLSVVPSVPIEIRPGNIEHDWPDLNPHFATGFEFFSKRLWDSFTNYELGDGRRMYRAAVQRGMKMGVHRAIYGESETCWGREWFHLSDLTQHYYLIEGLDLQHLNPESSHQLARIGFFLFQEKIYGDTYPDRIKINLEKVVAYMRGREKCLSEWNKLISGTCMQDWRKYD